MTLINFNHDEKASQFPKSVKWRIVSVVLVLLLFTSFISPGIQSVYAADTNLVAGLTMDTGKIKVSSRAMQAYDGNFSVDGSTTTYWRSYGTETSTPWIRFDVGDSKLIKEFNLYEFIYNDHPLKEFVIEVSDNENGFNLPNTGTAPGTYPNNSYWKKVYQGTTLGEKWTSIKFDQFLPPYNNIGVTARYVQIRITDRDPGCAIGLAEIKIMGSPISINHPTFGEPQLLGNPFLTSYVDNSTFSVEDGNDIMGATVEGDPAAFYVYDLDDNRTLRSFNLPGAEYAHGHATAPNKDIYIATQSNAKLFKYSPTTKNITDLGSIAGELAAYQVSFDTAGNPYVGTYPDAKIVKYDLATNKYHDYGTIFPGEKYGRAHVFHNGYIYAGGYAQGTRLSKMNVTTGQVTRLTNPSKEGVFTGDDVKLFYFFTKIGNSIFATFATSKTSYCVGVYDLTQEKWVDVIVGAEGLQFPQAYGGKTYFVKSDKLVSYDIDTREIVDTGIPFTGRLRGCKIIIVANSEFPGVSLATVDYETGKPVIINFETKKVRILTEAVVPKKPIDVRAMGSGIGNKVVMGSYKSNKGVIYDTVAKTYTEFPIGQVEGIDAVNGQYYLGEYSGAYIYRYNPDNPIVSGTNPIRLKALGNSQSRIFQFTAANNLVAMASTPGSTSLGGALSLYDPATKELNVYRNIVQDQSVCSVAYNNGKIYGSTHIWGGLSTTPIATESKIFIFDVATRTKTKEVTLKIPEISTPIRMSGSLSFGPDGLLWGITKGAIFALNPSTLSLVKYKIIGDTVQGTGTVWTPFKLIWMKNGLMLAENGGALTLFNPTTLGRTQILDNVYTYTLDKSGNIYYTEGRNFLKVPVSY